jgi:tRNA(Ile2) C34 agmatinyltransferase TiaS
LFETKGEMMDIKRYDIYPDMIINEEVGSEMQCISEISQDGEYCLYSDIEPLIAENKRLREALEIVITIDDFQCPQCEADMETIYSNGIFHCKTCGNKYDKALKD